MRVAIGDAREDLLSQAVEALGNLVRGTPDGCELSLETANGVQLGADGCHRLKHARGVNLGFSPSQRGDCK